MLPNFVHTVTSLSSLLEGSQWHTLQTLPHGHLLSYPVGREGPFLSSYASCTPWLLPLGSHGTSTSTYHMPWLLHVQAATSPVRWLLQGNVQILVTSVPPVHSWCNSTLPREGKTSCSHWLWSSPASPNLGRPPLRYLWMFLMIWYSLLS
jgi:hypothetical protein